MDYPDNYKAVKSESSNSTDAGRTIGHQETGRTICIHSLAVHPRLQGVGLGKLIVFSYMQQVKNSRIADRVALICEEVKSNARLFFSPFPLFSDAAKGLTAPCRKIQYLVNYYKRFGFTHVGPSNANFGGGGWHDMVGGPAREVSQVSADRVYANSPSLPLRLSISAARLPSVYSVGSTRAWRTTTPLLSRHVPCVDSEALQNEGLSWW